MYNLDMSKVVSRRFNDNRELESTIVSRGEEAYEGQAEDTWMGLAAQGVGLRLGCPARGVRTAIGRW